MANIDFELIRSGRRTLAIEVTRDLRVVVRAPYGVSKKEIESFAESRSRWIQEAIERQKARGDTPAMREYTPQELAALRSKAREMILPRVEHYSALMGLSPTHVSITSARTRFGSCSGKNAVCFSCLLAEYPPEFVDYVVVHELAHIRYHNHSRNFYALIEQYMPDYRERRALSAVR